MSFLAGRLAATEEAFFSQTSKQAIARLQEATRKTFDGPLSANDAAPPAAAMADVLPEILKHSLPRHPADALPPTPLLSFSPSPSSLIASLASPGPTVAPLSQSRLLELTGPFSYLPRLPQVSFSSSRWKPPPTEVSRLPSTANEANIEGHPAIDDARAKALAEGYFTVMKAFLVATAFITGCATVAGGVVASRFEIHSFDDIRTKGQEYMQSRAQVIQQSLEPWKQWVQKRNKQRSIDAGKQNSLSSSLGLKQLLKEE